MKVLIATGIYPPEIGGPATYAKRLSEEFRDMGHEVMISTYRMEKYLPSGLRHIVYFIKSFPKVVWSEKILVLDTFSVGIPIALSTTLVYRPYVIRIGGDFLWELYVNRTNDALPIPVFYNQDFLPKLTLKEKTIFRLTKFVLDHATRIAFTTEWFKNIWVPVYKINPFNTLIIENTLELKDYQKVMEKKFLWAGRNKFLKNIDLMKVAFAEASKENKEISLECVQVSKEELEKKLAQCYAVILPSLSEVSPNFIHDSISHRKPFLVTKYNGLNKKVESLGLVIDPLSVNDIKEKILEISNDDQYEKMVLNLKNFSTERSWKKVAQDFIRELEQSK